MADPNNPFAKYAPPSVPSDNPFAKYGPAPSENEQSGDIPPEMWKQFGLGAAQGVVGVPEAIYQGAEKLGAPRVPEAIRAPLRSLRDKADATWPGVVGEAFGGVIPFLAGGEALDALGIAPRVAAALPKWLSPATRTALTTAGQSTIAQPSRAQNLPDFLTEKAEDAGLGAILGRILGRPTQQAQHDAAAAANAAEAKTTTEANAAAQAAHEQTVATEKEQHAALTEAQKQYHAGERTKVQAATDALGKQTTADLRQAQTQRTARGNVPRETTSGWWQRTLEPIGEATDPNLFKVSPETAAVVQDRVAARLNSITDQMHLDTGDPAFREHLNTIRDETQIPESDSKSWYHEEPEPEQERYFVHPTTGKPLERTTRGVREKQPKPPSGDFQKTVLEPLEKGPLTGRDLTNYISKIGDKAEEFARAAQGRPQAERESLQNRATALRQVQDAVIGHAAADNPELKLARDQASRAYMMWSVGNDAARASAGGVATPKQLIDTYTQRLGRAGRGRARYNRSLIDPNDPHHATTTWLQQQQAAHTTKVPTPAEVKAGQPEAPTPLERQPTPIPPPSPRTPPVPQQPPTPRPVPKAPPRGGRNWPRALEHAGLLGLFAHHGEPWLAGYQLSRLMSALKRRENIPEGRLESLARKAMTGRPRVQRGARGAAAGAAAQVPKNLNPGDVEGNAANMYYRWRGNQ